MVPTNLNFWSISRKDSLESQQKHGLKNRFWRALLCSKTISIPDTIGKCSLERVHPFLTKVVLIMKLFHPVQGTACKSCQSTSIDKVVLSRATGILTISDQLHYL